MHYCNVRCFNKIISILFYSVVCLAWGEKYVSKNKTIFYLYQFLRDQPIFLGAIVGAFVGLIYAGISEVRTNVAVIGGAIGGAVVMAMILRLRLR